MEDKTLVCGDCNEEFVFSANEQEFYAEKGFENEPKRCPSCRAQRKQKFNSERQMHEATCSNCGVETSVPFKPVEDRPVYCKECYTSAR